MIYLAGPWFTVRQAAVLESVKGILDEFSLEYYSPKDEMPFKEFTAGAIYRGNIEHIHNADLMIVITDGKDVGTMFEAGYAAALGIPIVYLWAEPIKNAKFNIMLAQSGEACYLGLKEFSNAMEYYFMTNSILKQEYKGNME